MKKAPRWTLAMPGVVALGLLTACGGKPVSAPGIHEDVAAKPRPTVVPSLIGHLLGSIGEHTVGPFLARSENGNAGMVAWITGAEAASRRVIVNPVSGVGEPKGGGRTIAVVGIDTSMLVVRPTRGKNPGFALVWRVLTDRGEALWSVIVGEDGVARSKPIELARTMEDIVWIEIVPTDAGAVCLWAEETREASTNVLAAGLDGNGKVIGAPSRVARGAVGWHALAVSGGVGLSTVVTEETPKKNEGHPGKGTNAPSANEAPRSTKAPDRGKLVHQRLGFDGQALAPPTTIVPKASVSGDVEVVRAPHGLVFAWTDRSGDEPSVAAAMLAEDGTVVPSRKVVEARGGASLLALASGGSGVAIAFESPVRKGVGDARSVRSGRLTSELGLEGQTVALEVMGRVTPEIVGLDQGFAILAPQRDCDVGSPRCLDAPVIPTVVRTDAHLAPVQREPLGFGTDPASIAWGMTCDSARCVALAASGPSPIRIRAAEVRRRTNVAVPVAVKAKPRAVEGPQLSQVTAVASGESIIDVAVTRMEASTLLATLSSPPEPTRKGRVAIDDVRNAPLRITTRRIDASGSTLPPVIVTTRALATGGVSMAPAAKPEDGAAVAWVARDNGDPEVHVTKVDKAGKVTKDLRLTTVKGDASDVAIAWAGDGWIVAWIDARDGNGEVYATRVGFDLSRGIGQRITTAPGDASDLVIHAVGELVWLAWADPRENPRDGTADVFLSAIGKDAKVVVPEQRLLATAAHSRTPQLAPANTNDGVHVAWIEEAPLGVVTPSSSGYGAMWATFSAGGSVKQRPTRIPTAGEGAAVSVALDPRPAGLRAVVARSTAEAVVLDGIDLSGTEPRALQLFSLDGPPSLDVALVVEEGTLFFNDDGPVAADKRVRRARLAW